MLRREVRLLAMAEAYFVARVIGEEALRNAVLFVRSCEREVSWREGK
jgi:hypothetical protein